MASDTAETVSAAAQALDAAATEKAAEIAAPAVAAAVEAAQDRIEAAEETAEQIAAAAMESERGRRIETLEQENASWRNQTESRLSAMETSLAAIQADMGSMRETLAAATATAAMVASSLTPPPPPAPQEPVTETIIPGEAVADAQEVVENPVRRIRRWT